MPVNPRSHPGGSLLQPRSHPGGSLLQPRLHPGGSLLQPRSHPGGTVPVKRLCKYKCNRNRRETIVQELCESRGGRPGLSVLTSLPVSMDVKNY